MILFGISPPPSLNMCNLSFLRYVALFWLLGMFWKFCPHSEADCFLLPAVINHYICKNNKVLFPFSFSPTLPLSLSLSVLFCPWRLIAVLLRLPYCCWVNHGFAVLGKVYQRSGIQNKGNNKYQLEPSPLPPLSASPASGCSNRRVWKLWRRLPRGPVSKMTDSQPLLHSGNPRQANSTPHLLHTVSWGGGEDGDANQASISHT